MDGKRRPTGRKDCKGRDIYEGDIVKVGALTGAVTYDERFETFFFGILPYEVMKESVQKSIEIVGQATKPEDYVSVLN